MAPIVTEQGPWGHRWRSSTPFVIICIGIALFAESFLYGFVVPILPYILQDRNHVDPSHVQRITYLVLTLYGGVSMASALFVGQLADLAKTRRTPLVLSLVITFVGTLSLAASTNLWGVYLGRVVQSVGGTAAWIIGLATVRDSIEAKHMGKVFGLVHGCVSVGALSGPAAAGLLLEMAGYWMAWGSVLLVLMLDIGMRLVMLEKRGGSNLPQADDDYTSRHTGPDEIGEASALISDTPVQSYNSTTRNAVDSPAASFYNIIFSQRRVVVGLACSVVYSATLASYNTTIPTHARSAFGWGSLPTGLLFTMLQGPTIVLSPLCGWFRDRFGTRLPATIGFALLAPFMWLLGAADQKQFPWATSEDSAKHTYVAAIIGLGCVTNLVSSVGTVEMTCAADDLESRQPGILGPNKGYSRCYSISNLSYSTGMLLGPLLSGALTDSLGYYFMNSVLACICAVMSVLAISSLGEVRTS